jgi:hypothetical protein
MRVGAARRTRRLLKIARFGADRQVLQAHGLVFAGSRAPADLVQDHRHVEFLLAGEIQIAAARVAIGDLHDLTGDRAVRCRVVHVGLARFRDERHGRQVTLDACASSQRDSERSIAHDLEPQLLALVLEVEGGGVGVREHLGLHQDPLAQQLRVRLRGQCNADLDQFAIGF